MKSNPDPVDIPRARWEQLMKNDELLLTPEEIAAGWHFCAEFDGLLIGPGWGELHACLCWPVEHPVYQTKPPAEGGYYPLSRWSFGPTFKE